MDTGNGARLTHREDERFPFCSIFKALAASAALRESERIPQWMQRRIPYRSSDLVDNSPVTEKHVATGMMVAELNAAALQSSENTAGNLLIRLAGGTEALTAFARTIGDTEFRLDRWDTELNTSLPGDPHDATTPRAMAHRLQHLALDDALQTKQCTQLQDWILRTRRAADAYAPASRRTGRQQTRPAPVTMAAQTILRSAPTRTGPDGDLPYAARQGCRCA